MKAILAIEWPETLGKDWMNAGNLIICLQETCPNTAFTVTDPNNETVTCKPLHGPPVVALQIAARIWCDKEMEKTEMDIDAAIKIARIIDKVRNENN